MSDISIGSKKEKSVGLIALWGLIISIVIGGGVFNLPRDIVAGGANLAAIIIAWAIIGAGMALVGFSFYRLSIKHPDLDAGLESFAEVGFGKFMGFNSTWGYLISNAVGNTAFALMIVQGLASFFPDVFGDESSPIVFIACSVLIWCAFFLLLTGIRESSIISTLVACVKLTPILLFIVVLFFSFKINIWTSDFWGPAFQNGIFYWGDLFSQVRSTMLFAVFLFVGIEGAVVVSGRAKNKKQVGVATVSAILSVTLIYFLISILSFGVMKQQELSELSSPAMGVILNSLVGGWGKVLISVTFIVSVFNALFTATIFGSELSYQGGLRGVFPKAFTKANRKNAPASSALIFTLVTQVIMVFLFMSPSAYEWSINMCAILVLLPYLFSTLYYIKTTVKDSTSKVSDYIISIGSTVFIIWALAAGGTQVLAASIFYVVGIAVYYWTKKVEQKQDKVFKPYELVIAGAICLLAIISLTLLIMGRW
jgi:arginine:ornithine antiporter/lysine permease